MEPPTSLGPGRDDARRRGCLGVPAGHEIYRDVEVPGLTNPLERACERSCSYFIRASWAERPHRQTMPARVTLPPLTRSLLLALISLSTLNAGLRFRSWVAETTPQQQVATSPSTYLSSPEWAIPYLVLIPTKSIWYPWTFLTAAVIENNIVSLAISGAVVWFGGKYLERAWGTQEFGKFVLFVTVTPNVIAFCLYGAWHAATGQTPEQYAFEVTSYS